MTFKEICTLIAEDAAPDGSIIVKMPTSGDVYSSSFGLRIRMALDAFARASYLYFALAAEYQLQAGDLEFDLVDGSRSPTRVFEPWAMSVGTRRITRVDAGYLTSIRVDGATQPMYWGVLADTSIQFDRPLDVDTTVTVTGPRLHVEITDDDQPVQMSNDRVLLFKSFASAELREPTTGDEVGVARLQRYDSKAAAAILSIRGEQMQRLLSADPGPTWGPRYIQGGW